MGFFDTIRWHARFPDSTLGAQPVFQTYSLGRGMNRYTVTEEGRLLYHPVRDIFFGETETAPARRSSSPGGALSPGIDLEFHGDLLLHPLTESQSAVEYAARFTQGILEWVRPLADLSATHRQWLSALGGD
jgi:hypothetical protein